MIASVPTHLGPIQQGNYVLNYFTDSVVSMSLALGYSYSLSVLR